MPNYISAWHPLYPQLCWPSKGVVLVSYQQVKYILPPFWRLKLLISLWKYLSLSVIRNSRIENNSIYSRTTTIEIFEPKGMWWGNLVLETAFFENRHEKGKVVGLVASEFYFLSQCLFLGLRFGLLSGLGDSGYMRDKLKRESHLKWAWVGISIQHICHGRTQQSMRVSHTVMDCGSTLDGAQKFKYRLDNITKRFHIIMKPAVTPNPFILIL